jgi:hypothetical protein
MNKCYSHALENTSRLALVRSHRMLFTVLSIAFSILSLEAQAHGFTLGGSWIWMSGIGITNISKLIYLERRPLAGRGHQAFECKGHLLLVSHATWEVILENTKSS